MKTKTTILAAFSAAALAIGVTAVVLINQPVQVATPKATSAVPGAQTQNVVTYTAKKGVDVLTQLKDHASVTTKDSAYGPYVDAINGITGGTDGKYWSFYVDGTLAQKGAADYVTSGGETIQWKFQ